MLAVPKIRTKGSGGRKFSYSAATLWNDLHSTDLQTVLLQEVAFSSFFYALCHNVAHISIKTIQYNFAF